MDATTEDPFLARPRYVPPGDAQVGLIALATVGGVWVGASVGAVRAALLTATAAAAAAAVALVVTGVAIARRARIGIVARGVATACVVLVVLGAIAGERAWERAEPRSLGPFAGWAVVASDPVPARSGSGVGVVLEVAGERFQAYAYGSPRRRLERRQAGDLVAVEGVRSSLRARDGWLRVRHVVGRFEVARVGAWAEGAPLDRAGNRLRARLRAAAESTMPADDAALFTGLVVGDDVRQRPEVVDRFREVGLSHLTAVSGQNVAYVVAMAGVVLRRLPGWWRLAATWALIAWFVVLTRVEPSVLRAGTMAAIGAFAVATGRERSVPRLLAVAVTVLVLVDPLLVWSVGFWLSCGATVGVSVVAPWLSQRWRGPAWLAMPVATTVGAQLGVLVPSLLVFGRLPVTGIVANLLAVPVAGVVMLVGIPAALLASAAPPAVAEVVMLPAEWGTRWVGTVAALAERLTPAGPVLVAAWAVHLALALWWWRPDRW